MTTYIDGVPQLNANSLELELLGIEQIGLRARTAERTVRTALRRGRRTSPAAAVHELLVWRPRRPLRQLRIRGYAGDCLRAARRRQGGSGDRDGIPSRRDGYTENDVTGHDLDSRSAFFGKGQLLFRPANRWEARALLTVERARDGDYALNDVTALRNNPFHASRNVEGFTHRDIIAPTFHLTRAGQRVDLSSVTGFLKWKTDDLTDLDYTAAMFATRTNTEEDFQFTEEVRISSAKTAPIALSRRVSLKWQAGLFLFTQNYEQDAVNSYSSFALSPLVAFPVSQRSPQSDPRRPRSWRLRAGHVHRLPHARCDRRSARRS